MNLKAVGVLLSPALLAASLIYPTALYAEWTGGIEGGQVIDGDDEGTRIRFKLSNNSRPFSQAFFADWIRSSDADDSFQIGYTPRYWFTDSIYGFGEGSIRTSNALLIDRQTQLLAGVGIQLLSSKSQSLYAEIGAGQITTEFEDIVGIAQEEEDAGIAVARFGASQTLSDILKLELDGDFSTSDELEQGTAEAGISLRVAGGAVKYGFRYRSIAVDDGDPLETTDSFVTFNYGF